MDVYKDKKKAKKNPMSLGGDRRQTTKKRVKVRGCGAAKKGCHATGPMG